MKSILSQIFIAIFLGLTLTITSQAQTVTAISGHVKDPQGANLPGATVTLYARELRGRHTCFNTSFDREYFESGFPTAGLTARAGASFIF
jgi:hypothetical protein